MADENNPAVEQGTGVPVDQIPTDFREYNRWRDTGELPRQLEEPAPAAADATSEPAKAGEPATPAKTAPDSGTDDSQDTDEEPEPRKGTRQRKIDFLTRENAELQRRLKALEDAAPPAARVDSPSTPPPPAGTPSTAKPDLAEFKTLEEYVAAMVRWERAEEKRIEKEESAKAEAQKAAAAEQDTWAKRETAAIKAHPDYQDTLNSVKHPKGPGVPGMRQALLEDENGAEILYQLAKNPAELERIAGLSPVRAAIEIGKLSASISTSSNGAPENPKPRVSGAPKPPSPITRGTVKTSDNVYDEDTARDFKRWNKAREAQLKE